MRRLCNKKLRFIFRRADSLIFAEDRGKIGGVFVAYCLRNLISEQVCILEKLLCLADPFLIDVFSKRTGGGFLEGTAQMGRGNVQLLGNNVQGKISRQVLGNITDGVFNNIVGNCVGGHAVLSCVFHNFRHCIFQGKNIPGSQKRFQIQNGHRIQLLFYHDTAADVVDLGADVLGILGIGKAGFELGKNVAGNRSGLLEIPVVQAAFNLVQIQGVFHRKLCRLFRASSVENRNILFAVKVMGKSLDCLGNSSLESLRRLMKGADPRKDLRRAESLYNTGNLPAVFQNIFRNRSRGLILEIFCWWVLR